MGPIFLGRLLIDGRILSAMMNMKISLKWFPEIFIKMLRIEKVKVTIKGINKEGNKICFLDTCGVNGGYG
jgi:hypothetical protein